ncbi:MAG: M24 family metallopeptidase, partial [Elusimicrobiota bacterium]
RDASRIAKLQELLKGGDILQDTLKIAEKPVKKNFLTRYRVLLITGAGVIGAGISAVLLVSAGPLAAAIAVIVSAGIVFTLNVLGRKKARKVRVISQKETEAAPRKEKVGIEKINIEKIQELLRNEGKDGWLFYDYNDLNSFARSILGIESIPANPWFYYIPAKGEPVVLTSQNDQKISAGLPGKKIIYKQDKLEEELKSVLGKAKTIVMEYSPNAENYRASYVDGGTFEVITGMGIKIDTSVDVSQYLIKPLGQEEIESHKRAAKLVTTIVRDDAFGYIRDMIVKGEKITEYDVQRFIMNRFKEENLETTADQETNLSEVIVAINENASDPHYIPNENKFKEIKPGDLVLIDLWAKEKDKENAVFADITWMAYVGKKVPKEYTEIFNIVKGARDAALNAVKDAFFNNQHMRGVDIDAAARDYIKEAGYGNFFVHGTGHSIDGDIHGGVNKGPLANEVDTGKFFPGYCFSIEPGIYLDSKFAEDSDIQVKRVFGIRSEIDVYLDEKGEPRVVTGIQDNIIPLMEGIEDFEDVELKDAVVAESIGKEVVVREKVSAEFFIGNASVKQIQREILDAGLDGWLIYSGYAKNPIADKLVSLGKGFSGTKSFYYIPVKGEPEVLYSILDQRIFEDITGNKNIYVNGEQSREKLKKILQGANKIAMEYVPGKIGARYSRVDQGTLDLIKSVGVKKIVSSENLIKKALFDSQPLRAKKLRKIRVVVQKDTMVSAEKIKRDIYGRPILKNLKKYINRIFGLVMVVVMVVSFGVIRNNYAKADTDRDMKLEQPAHDFGQAIKTSAEETGDTPATANAAVIAKIAVDVNRAYPEGRIIPLLHVIHRLPPGEYTGEQVKDAMDLINWKRGEFEEKLCDINEIKKDDKGLITTTSMGKEKVLPLGTFIKLILSGETQYRVYIDEQGNPLVRDIKGISGTWLNIIGGPIHEMSFYRDEKDNKEYVRAELKIRIFGIPFNKTYIKPLPDTTEKEKGRDYNDFTAAGLWMSDTITDHIGYVGEETTGQEMVIDSAFIIPFLMAGGRVRRKQDESSEMSPSVDKQPADTAEVQKPVQVAGQGSRISKMLKIIFSVFLVTTLLGCNAFFTNFMKNPNPRLDRPLSYRSGKDVQKKNKIDKKTEKEKQRTIKNKTTIKDIKRPSSIQGPRLKQRKPAKRIIIKKPAPIKKNIPGPGLSMTDEPLSYEKKIISELAQKDIPFIAGFMLPGFGLMLPRKKSKKDSADDDIDTGSLSLEELLNIVNSALGDNDVMNNPEYSGIQARLRTLKKGLTDSRDKRNGKASDKTRKKIARELNLINRYRSKKADMQELSCKKPEDEGNTVPEKEKGAEYSHRFLGLSFPFIRARRITENEIVKGALGKGSSIKEAKSMPTYRLTLDEARHVEAKIAEIEHKLKNRIMPERQKTHADMVLKRLKEYYARGDIVTFDGLVKGAEDYSLGYTTNRKIVLSKDFLSRPAFYDYLDELLFHEGYSSVFGEGGYRTHQAIVNGIQRFLFGKENPLVEPIRKYIKEKFFESYEEKSPEYYTQVINETRDILKERFDFKVQEEFEALVVNPDVGDEFFEVVHYFRDMFGIGDLIHRSLFNVRIGDPGASTELYRAYQLEKQGYKVLSLGLAVSDNNRQVVDIDIVAYKDGEFYYFYEVKSRKGKEGYDGKKLERVKTAVKILKKGDISNNEAASQVASQLSSHRADMLNILRTSKLKGKKLESPHGVIILETLSGVDHMLYKAKNNKYYSSFNDLVRTNRSEISQPAIVVSDTSLKNTAVGSPGKVAEIIRKKALGLGFKNIVIDRDFRDYAEVSSRVDTYTVRIGKQKFVDNLSMLYGLSDKWDQRVELIINKILLHEKGHLTEPDDVRIELGILGRYINRMTDAVKIADKLNRSFKEDGTMDNVLKSLKNAIAVLNRIKVLHAVQTTGISEAEKTFKEINRLDADLKRTITDAQNAFYSIRGSLRTGRNMEKLEAQIGGLHNVIIKVSIPRIMRINKESQANLYAISKSIRNGAAPMDIMALWFWFDIFCHAESEEERNRQITEYMRMNDWLWFKRLKRKELAEKIRSIEREYSEDFGETETDEEAPAEELAVDLSHLSNDEMAALEYVLLAVNGVKELIKMQAPEGTKELPGKGLYPADLTADELEEYIGEHPEQKEELENSYTVIERENGKLKAVPYAVKYSEKLTMISGYLKKAASVIKRKDMAVYFNALADALLEKDIENIYPALLEAERLWLEMENAPFYLVIAPTDFYSDGLLKHKPFYEAFIWVQNSTMGGRLEMINSLMDDMGDDLKSIESIRPHVRTEDKNGEKRINKAAVYDTLLEINNYDGQPTGGINYPGEDSLQKNKNIAFLNVLKPVFELKKSNAASFMAGELHGLVTFRAFVMRYLLHELGHFFLVPSDERADELGASFLSIFEAVAEIYSLYQVEFLRSKSAISDAEAREMYATYLASELYEYVGEKSDYRIGPNRIIDSLMQNGIIIYEDGMFDMDLEDLGEIHRIIRGLLEEAVKIQEEGTPGEVTTFINGSPDEKERFETIRGIARGVIGDMQVRPDHRYVTAEELLQKIESGKIIGSDSITAAESDTGVTAEKVRIETDISGLSDNDRETLGYILKAVEGVKDILKKQAPEGTHHLPGKGLMPADMTSEEFNLYISYFTDNQTQNNELMSRYTVIERRDGKLEAVPYAVKYEKELFLVAGELLKGAEVTDRDTIKTYMTLLADALVEKDLDEFDKKLKRAREAWLETRDEPFTFLLEPDDRYPDGIFKRKRFYEAYIWIVNDRYAERFKIFSDLFNEMDVNLNAVERFKEYRDYRDLAGFRKSNWFRAYDMLYHVGFDKAPAMGLDHPRESDERISGNMSSVLINIIEDCKYDEFRQVADRMMVSEQARMLDIASIVDLTGLHELGHQLLLGSLSSRGKLAGNYTYVTELIAELNAVYQVPFLVSRKVINEQEARAIYVAFLVMMLRSGAKDDEDYWMGYRIVLHRLIEAGFLIRENGRYRLDLEDIEGLHDLVTDLLSETLKIQEFSTSEQIRDFVDGGEPVKETEREILADLDGRLQFEEQPVEYVTAAEILGETDDIQATRPLVLAEQCIDLGDKIKAREILKDFIISAGMETHKARSNGDLKQAEYLSGQLSRAYDMILHNGLFAFEDTSLLDAEKYFPVIPNTIITEQRRNEIQAEVTGKVKEGESVCVAASLNEDTLAVLKTYYDEIINRGGIPVFIIGEKRAFDDLMPYDKHYNVLFDLRSGIGGEQRFSRIVGLSEDINKAAEAAVENLLQASSSDDVLITGNFGNTEGFNVAMSLYDAALEKGAFPMIVLQPIKHTGENIEDPFRGVLERVALRSESAKPVIHVCLHKDRFGHDPKTDNDPDYKEKVMGDRNAPYDLTDFINATTRDYEVAAPGIGTRTFIQSAGADYENGMKYSRALLERSWRGVDTVDILDSEGNKLTVDLAGRQIRDDVAVKDSVTGDCNLPGMEVFVSPNKASSRTNGVFVVNHVMMAMGENTILADEPVKLTVENGFVTNIEGGAAARLLEATLKNAEEKIKELYRKGDIKTKEKKEEWLRNVRHIGEFAWGVDTGGKTLINLLNDEKIGGTVHIALGYNYSVDIDNRAMSLTHYDLLAEDRTVVVNYTDGSSETVFKDGNIVMEEAVPFAKKNLVRVEKGSARETLITDSIRALSGQEYSTYIQRNDGIKESLQLQIVSAEMDEDRTVNIVYKVNGDKKTIPLGVINDTDLMRSAKSLVLFDVITGRILIQDLALAVLEPVEIASLIIQRLAEMEMLSRGQPLYKAIPKSEEILETYLRSNNIVPAKFKNKLSDFVISWKNYFEAVAIHADSKDEAKMRDYITAKLTGMGLTYIEGGKLVDQQDPSVPGIFTVDDTGNILARIYPTNGMEEYILVQAHMDMALISDDKERDWSLPVKTKIIEENDEFWMMGEGANLGNDNAIGIAGINWLAHKVLNDTKPHIGLEFAFTIDEEEDFTGAYGIDMSQFKSKDIINTDGDIVLDKAGEGKIRVGAAAYVSMTSEIKTGLDVEAAPMFKPVTSGMQAVKVDIRGGKGGHSGVDIDKGRINAINALIDIVSKVPGSEVVLFEGGELENAIAKSASALILTPDPDKTLNMIKETASGITGEYRDIEDELTITASPYSLSEESAEAYNSSRGNNAIQEMINSILGQEWGVIARYDDGKTMKSTVNLGVLKGDAMNARADFLLRSVDQEHLWIKADEYQKAIPGTIVNSSIDVYDSPLDSRIAQFSKKAVEELTGSEFIVYGNEKGEQDTVELGVMANEKNYYKQKFNGIIIGADSREAHTVNEKVKVPSYPLYLEWMYRIVEEYSKPAAPAASFLMMVKETARRLGFKKVVVAPDLKDTPAEAESSLFMQKDPIGLSESIVKEQPVLGRSARRRYSNILNGPFMYYDIFVNAFREETENLPDEIDPRMGLTVKTAEEGLINERGADFLPPDNIILNLSRYDRLKLRVLSIISVLPLLAGYAESEIRNLIKEKSKIDHRTSPTNIGLNVLMSVIEWQSGRITEDEALKRIKKIVNVIEKLPKYKGHLYNWYNTQYLYVYEDNWYKNGNNKQKKLIHPDDFVASISTVDNGNFAAFMLIAANSISDTELKSRLLKIIRDMRFDRLYNEENGLLHFVGQHADIRKTEGFESGLHGSDGHYNLLLSENRIASMMGIMMGHLPAEHWTYLKRFVGDSNEEDSGAPALPWHGSSFEVKLPGIIMREDDSEMLHKVHAVTTGKQLAASMNGVFGKSETAYDPKDNGDSVGYGPVGVAENALDTADKVVRRDVYSPYAAQLEALWAPEEALRALKEYEKMGLRTPVGYYESVEFKEDGRTVIVPRVYAHHSAGMGGLALFNLLSGGYLQELFHTNPFNRGAVFEDELEGIPALIDKGLIREESPYYIVTGSKKDIEEAGLDKKTEKALLSAVSRIGIVEQTLNTPQSEYAVEEEKVESDIANAYDYQYQYRQEQVGVELPDALEGHHGYTIHA